MCADRVQTEDERRQAARDLIRRKRVSKGLVRWQAAKFTGLSLTTHVTIESGFRDRSYELSTLKRIAAAFDIDLKDLMPLYVHRRPGM